MKLKKRVCCILCALMVLAIVPSGIYASSDLTVKQEYSPISPRWTGIISLSSELNAVDDKVNPYIKVRVEVNKVTTISFVGELRKKVNGRWTTVEDWDITKQVKSSGVIFDESYAMQTGFEYTYVTTVKAYNGTELLDTIDVKGPTKLL